VSCHSERKQWGTHEGKMSSGPFFALFPFMKKVLVLHSIAYCHKKEMLVVYTL
jgi:hypothetical protein